VSLHFCHSPVLINQAKRMAAAVFHPKLVSNPGPQDLIGSCRSLRSNFLRRLYDVTVCANAGPAAFFSSARKR
jgi:hypothetical protein